LSTGRLCSTTTRKGKGEESPPVDTTKERRHEEKSSIGIFRNDKQNVTSCKNIRANGEPKHF